MKQFHTNESAFIYNTTMEGEKEDQNKTEDKSRNALTSSTTNLVGDTDIFVSEQESMDDNSKKIICLFSMLLILFVLFYKFLICPNKKSTQ